MKLFLVICYLSLVVLSVFAEEQPDHSKDFEVVELVNDEDPEYFDLDSPEENTEDKNGTAEKGRPSQAPQRPYPGGLRPGGGSRGGKNRDSPSSVGPRGSFIGRHDGAGGYRVGSRGGSGLGGRRGGLALAGGRGGLALGGRRAGLALGGGRGRGGPGFGFRSARRHEHGGFRGIGGRRRSMQGQGGYRGDGITYEDDYNGQDYGDDYDNVPRVGRGGFRG